MGQMTASASDVSEPARSASERAIACLVTIFLYCSCIVVAIHLVTIKTDENEKKQHTYVVCPLVDAKSTAVKGL